MKRSEMVDLIFRRLGPVGISVPTCAEVLTLIEEAGMLPPRHYVLDYCGCCYYTSFNEWEAEDEAP